MSILEVMQDAYEQSEANSGWDPKFGSFGNVVIEAMGMIWRVVLVILTIISYLVMFALVTIPAWGPVLILGWMIAQGGGMMIAGFVLGGFILLALAVAGIRVLGRNK